MKATSWLFQAIDPGARSDDDSRIASWISLYNLLAIHGVPELGIRKSVMEIPPLFGVVAYRVGDFVHSLDEIDNGVLRPNRPLAGARVFGDDDPGLGLYPSLVDPRIHATFVCVSTICPPVAFYEGSKLDEQRDLAQLRHLGRRGA